MQTNIKRKPLILATAIVLALVTIVGATFAWFTAEDSAKNRLATKEALANVHIQETFVPPDDWKPGQTITKEVAVADVGTAPALVRISFKEELTVNQPAIGESKSFDAALEAAKKSPRLFDTSAYPHGAADDWFLVTTTANAAKGGVKLAAAYPVEVYAKHVTTGSIDSYSFVVWSLIQAGTGTDFDGEYQAVSYTREWDGDSKTLTLDNIGYLTYQGELSATADWKATPPAVADIDKSIAEGEINAMAAVAGKYPNNIQLNYDNVTATPTADKWFYNVADGCFYFIGLVEPGTITPHMLASLLLKPAADSDYYANMTFDLIVDMQAIQHTKDAVASIWTGATGTLQTELYALCES